MKFQMDDHHFLVTNGEIKYYPCIMVGFRRLIIANRNGGYDINPRIVFSSRRIDATT